MFPVNSPWQHWSHCVDVNGGISKSLQQKLLVWETKDTYHTTRLQIPSCKLEGFHCNYIEQHLYPEVIMVWMVSIIPRLGEPGNKTKRWMEVLTKSSASSIACYGHAQILDGYTAVMGDPTETYEWHPFCIWPAASHTLHQNHSPHGRAGGGQKHHKLNWEHLGLAVNKPILEQNLIWRNFGRLAVRLAVHLSNSQSAKFSGHMLWR